MTNFFKIKENITKKKEAGELLTNEEASILLEYVLDTLVEVGNGVTDSDLHDAADDLFQFRDFWFNRVVDTRRNENEKKSAGKEASAEEKEIQ